jgi:hypothetical protein
MNTKNYKVKQFNSKYNDELFKSFKNIESSMYVLKKEDFNYKAFYELFNLYLKKMPNNNVTKYSKSIIDRNGVFVGLHGSPPPKISVFARVNITSSFKLAGIALDSRFLEINKDGETDNIDNCIYATYFSLVRAAVLCNEKKINSDFDFHNMCISYIYYVILKSMGRIQTLSKFQLDGVYLACSYLYFRQHLELNHASALSRMSRLYKDILDKDTVKQYVEKFEILSKYKLIKEIGKALIDINVIDRDPNKILIGLIQMYGKEYFYNLVGPLSFLTGVIVLGNYPTDLFDKPITINTKIQNKVEYYITKYIDKIGYSIDIYSKQLLKD